MPLAGPKAYHLRRNHRMHKPKKQLEGLISWGLIDILDVDGSVIFQLWLSPMKPTYAHEAHQIRVKGSPPTPGAGHASPTHVVHSSLFYPSTSWVAPG